MWLQPQPAPGITSKPVYLAPKGQQVNPASVEGHDAKGTEDTPSWPDRDAVARSTVEIKSTQPKERLLREARTEIL